MRRAGSSFLIGQGEVEDFNRPERFRPRHVIPFPIFGAVSAKEAAREELTTAVLNRFRAIARRSGRWFGCCSVTIEPDDGMSWSAERVAQALATEYPNFDVLRLARKTASNSLPHIVQLLGQRKVMKAAVRCHLADWYPTLNVTHGVAVIAGIFLLGVVAATVQAALKIWSPSTPQQANQLFNPWLLLAPGVLAILAVPAKRLADYLSSDREKKSIKEFTEKLSSFETGDGYGTESHANFVEELAESLEWDAKPRVVIIDNYEGLDITTRRTVERYLQEYAKDASSSEFWVIFEHTDGAGFSKILQQEKSKYEDILNASSMFFFRQEFLAKSELLKLCELLGHEDTPVYAAVKPVVLGKAETDRVFLILKAYKDQHPLRQSRYGALEFLYFMALAASPSRIEFSRNQISSSLSAKKLERSAVLRRILVGSELKKGDFQEDLDTIARDFKEVISSTELSADREIAFSGELANTFRHRAGELGDPPERALPDAPLIHLYWALYWYDDSQPRATDPYRLRKLSYHLLNTDVSTAGSCSLTGKYFDAVIYAINGSLRACIFKDLRSLIDKAFKAYNSMETAGDGQPAGRFAGVCWDVYSVTGDERMLAYLGNLQEPPASYNVQTLGNDLLSVFLDATLDQDLRNSLSGLIRNWLAQSTSPKNDPRVSVIHNADGRAGWLISTLADLSPWKGVAGTLLGNVTVDGQVLRDDFRSTWQKMLHEKSALPLFTDVTTLTLCLWSFALLEKSIQNATGYSELVGMSEEAILIAHELKKTARSKGELELLLFALAREVYAVALACLLMLCQQLRAAGLEDPKIYELLRQGRSLWLGSKEANDGFDFGQWADYIDDLFAESTLIWTRFELDNLRDYARLRRLQFNSICRELTPDDHQRLTPLVEAASSILSIRGYPAILGNCVMATCHRGAAELRAYYVLEAAQDAIRDELELPLQRELAMLAIEEAHSFSIDLELFLKLLLFPSALDGKSTLRLFLGELEEASIPGYALAYLNAANRVQDATVFNSVVETLREVSNVITHHTWRTEVESLLLYFHFEHRATRDMALPSVDQIIQEWQGHKDSWVYAGVVRILVAKSNANDWLYREGCSLLQRDASKDRNSSYLNLALELGSSSDSSIMSAEDRDILASYLRGAIKKWEDNISVDSNLASYRLLLALDNPNKTMYLEHVIKWDKIKIERDHRKRLRELASQEKYLLVFREYYDSARYWGLKHDLTETEWRDLATADFNRRTALLASWLAEERNVPRPVLPGNGAVVSARFLWMGQYLFSPPNDTNPAYDDWRIEVNQIAKTYLPHLVDTILKLPAMPEEVRTLLAHYSLGFLEETGLRTRPVTA